MLIFVAVVILFGAGVWVFVSTAPQFGKVPEGERLGEIKESPNYADEGFQNLVETSMDMGFRDVVKVTYAFFAGGSGRTPAKPIPVRFDSEQDQVDSLAYITWYGHSAILLEMDGRRLLLDPMLGPASSPVPFMTKRFPYEAPIPLDDIKSIDAVLISHDHYDHLDYPSILKLKEHVGKFYTALGVGEHLKRWGVESDKIVELDWWQDAELGSLRFTAAPARHFSGRGFDRNKTQWASWVIEGATQKIYFSGDGGYAEHFKEIGEKFGPFDFAMMECGQYNELWSQIHMMPEESVQAALDVKAQRMMPIHWGGFNLALHTWTDPIERVKEEANSKGIPLYHPYVGERFSINQEVGKAEWWK